MGDRGKKSFSEITAIKPAGISAIKRPEAPASLTDAQAIEWRAVVNRMPPDWFPRETHALLERYCCHVISANRIAEIIESMISATDSPGWLGDYDRLLKMQEGEGRALSSLATRMRLTQQTQYSHRKKTGPKMPAPWNH